MIEILPQIVASYIQAKNQHDTGAMLVCFANNAVVTDDGQELHGTTAIKQWINDTTSKYKVTLEITNSVVQADETVVKALVSGDFDGSPFPFVYRFKVNDDKITTLSVQS